MTMGAAVIVLVVRVAERYLLAARRVHVDTLERIRARLESRIDLEDDVILIERGEHRRDDALAKSIVERIVDRRRQNPETRGNLSIDRHIKAGTGVLLIGSDVGNSGQIPQLLKKNGRPVIEFVLVRVGQGVLILGLRQSRADGDVLRRLHV